MPTAHHAVVTNRVLAAFAGLSVLGLVGLAGTVLIGFEEPNGTLLLLSSVLVFAAPVAGLVHLGLTRTLTPTEKRIWLHELTGRRAAWALSEYLTCHDRRSTARRLAEEALARRRR
jgi:hypothetical protein